MKLLLVLFVGCQLFGLNISQAKTLKVRALISLSGELVDVDLDEVDNQGWRSRTDLFGEGDYDITLEVSEEELPIKKTVGPVFLSISKFGNINVGISVGDGDHSSSSEVLLPKQDKKLISFGQMNFKTSAGDFASGTWSFDANLTISVRD